MNHDTLAELHDATMLSVIFGIPGWLIFMPPRFMRSWPPVFRPFLAIICAMAAIYGIYFAITIPAFKAWASTHPDDFVLDGAIVIHPPYLWLPAAIMSATFYALLLCWRFLRRCKRHDAPPPTNRNS